MPDLGQAEADLLDWCNRARAIMGLSPLQSCPALTARARAKCAEIVGRAPGTHAGHHPGAARLQPAHGVQARTPDVEHLAAYRDHVSAFAALMHSPPHRDNILQPLHERIGVAVVPHAGVGVVVCMQFAGG